MDVYSKLKEFYLNHAIKFREIQHSQGATAEDYHNALGCKYEQQLKCLLLRIKGSTGKYYTLYVIQAQKQADLNDLKTKLEAKGIRMANRDELKKVTGCNFGEVPPAGKLFGIRMLLDKDFLKENEVFMNAGKVDVSFVVAPQDLIHVEEPTLI